MNKLQLSTLFLINFTPCTAAIDRIKIITDAAPDSTANPLYKGGDMWGETYPGVDYDKYHPNNKGNTKMALKFFKVLTEELEEKRSSTKID